MYGGLSAAQEKALEPFVRGRVVTDLGAGDCTLARKVKRMGASKVIAVDKETVISGAVIGRGKDMVVCERRTFAEYSEPIDVMLLSWPVNWFCPGLVAACERARIVIYLGNTMGGIMCGSCDLWEHLIGRQYLAVYPNRHNTLIVYGPPSKGRRLLLPEELAAFDTETIHDYVDRPPFPPELGSLLAASV